MAESRCRFSKIVSCLFIYFFHIFFPNMCNYLQCQESQKYKIKTVQNENKEALSCQATSLKTLHTLPPINTMSQSVL